MQLEVEIDKCPPRHVEMAGRAFTDQHLRFNSARTVSDMRPDQPKAKNIITSEGEFYPDCTYDAHFTWLNRR